MHTLVAEVGLIHGSSFEIVDDTYRMSTASQFNAERAAQLLYDGSVEKVICSGRGPVEGVTYETTEAQLMADYLLGMGIESKHIQLEDTSTSAVGNWAKSAPILDELNADSVLGITSQACCSRMQLIGDFVASQYDFELVGYIPSLQKSTAKEYARELVGRNLIRHFLNVNTDTPVDSLVEAYEHYKSRLGMTALKKHINQGCAAPNPL